MPADTLVSPPRPRSFGLINGLGLWTLYRRGVSRHIKWGWESLGGPCVSALLFLAIFTLAAGDRLSVTASLTVAQFIAPGIVMFSLSHAAYQSAAVALIHDKHEGMIGDLLGAPLTPLELVLGHVAAAATSGLITGAAVLALTLLFADFAWHDGWALALFAVLTAFLFGAVGTLTGLWADRWEHYSAVESFIMLPLMFLSGAFFALDSLPGIARLAVLANPLFYAVDGLRFGLTGFVQADSRIGAGLLAAATVALMLLVWRLFAVGYKVKP